MAPVDPDCLEAELLGRHVVVKEALGHVQHLFRRETNVRQGLAKVVQGRLVALDLLRGDDPIERDVGTGSDRPGPSSTRFEV